MEDRITPALYLEMTDADPEKYAAARVTEVLDRPGVTRATWWENVHRNRADLPRRLPEFGLLVVYELTSPDFDPPPPPAGVTPLLFAHYPRPGQGSLSGKPTLGLSLVLISPRNPEGGQALRDWGDFVHIRHIVDATIPGYTMITPYVNVDPAAEMARFMHFYEMDTDDAETAFKSMTPLVEKRLGARGSAEFDAWAIHPELTIDYVNSFRRLGEMAR
jgi:hypothetical protein